jgi:eukaryotic-like serine/threonine-protein kinase
MPDLTDAQWRSFSEQLDAALRLPEAQRGAWLATLAQAEPQVASAVERKLAVLKRPGFAGFLSGSALGPGAPQNSAEQAASLVGRRLGRYVIERQIGRGTMGALWCARAIDTAAPRRVAVKFVQQYWAGQRAGTLFGGKGRRGRLEHPHVARLLDTGLLEKSQPYLVLEFVEGEPIEEYCTRRALAVNARITLFLTVLDAVAHAHAHQIVHRNLKPTNILVNGDGCVKVLAFGLAELLNEDPAAAATHSYALALAPQFAAPEQLLGQPTSAATDVHALGLVLYQLLTGCAAQPHHGSGAERMRAAINDVPARASTAVTSASLRRALEGDLDAILIRALEREPARRYGSVHSFADELRRHLNHGQGGWSGLVRRGIDRWRR